MRLVDLPEDVRKATLAQALGLDERTLKEVEKDCILAALVNNGGNRRLTASVLEIGTATLYRKLKSYGLTDRPTAS